MCILKGILHICAPLGLPSCHVLPVFCAAQPPPPGDALAQKRSPELVNGKKAGQESDFVLGTTISRAEEPTAQKSQGPGLSASGSEQLSQAAARQPSTATAAAEATPAAEAVAGADGLLPGSHSSQQPGMSASASAQEPEGSLTQLLDPAGEAAADDVQGEASKAADQPGDAGEKQPAEDAVEQPSVPVTEPSAAGEGSSVRLLEASGALHCSTSTVTLLCPRISQMFSCVSVAGGGADAEEYRLASGSQVMRSREELSARLLAAGWLGYQLPQCLSQILHRR